MENRPAELKKMELEQLRGRRHHLHEMMRDSQEHAQIIHYEKRIEEVNKRIKKLEAAP